MALDTPPTDESLMREARVRPKPEATANVADPWDRLWLIRSLRPRALLLVVEVASSMLSLKLDTVPKDKLGVF